MFPSWPSGRKEIHSRLHCREREVIQSYHANAGAGKSATCLLHDGHSCKAMELRIPFDCLSAKREPSGCKLHRVPLWTDKVWNFKRFKRNLRQRAAGASNSICLLIIYVLRTRRSLNTICLLIFKVPQTVEDWNFMKFNRGPSKSQTPWGSSKI